MAFLAGSVPNVAISEGNRRVEDLLEHDQAAQKLRGDGREIGGHRTLSSRPRRGDRGGAQPRGQGGKSFALKWFRNG